MLGPEYAEFQFGPDSHWQWVETLALPFAVPEHNINVVCYVVTRPKMGVCAVDITIMDRIASLWEEQAYIDNMQHLPCPKRLSDFTLENGLSVKAVEPIKHYRVDYEGFDETSFHLDYRALHVPYDINDPELDPMASARNGPAWDSSWSGHYDITYHVTGKLTVRGKTYAVDCVDTGDRSWGPRPERNNSSVIWWHASFGQALTCHLFTGHDIATTDQLGPHISGYILENGELFGLTTSRGRQEYMAAMPMGGELEVTDVRGKTFAFTYSTVNGCYWAPYPSNTYLQASSRVAHNGLIGNGVQQMGLSRGYLTRNRDLIRNRA
jgi:hypothetical protein